MEICIRYACEKFPNKGIQEIHRVSYDGLEENEKDIFLDIACFFKGYYQDIFCVLEKNMVCKKHLPNFVCFFLQIIS